MIKSGGKECIAQGGEEEFIKEFAGKAIGIEPLGRPRRRWVDNT
jgi:hypothetical protein